MYIFNIPVGHVIYYHLFQDSIILGEVYQQYLTMKGPYPVGIADYGIIPCGNTLCFYTYNTTEVLGWIYIEYAHPRSYTVQLNADVYDNGTYLWVQDVLYVVGDNIFFEDNIWNVTYSWINNFHMYTPIENNSLSGNGEVYDGYAYIYSTDTMHYSYPLQVFLIMKVEGSNILFGYALDNNTIIWYDNVTVSNASNLTFIVGPQYNVNNGFAGFELVVGGPGNGKEVIFDNISGYLGLFYLYNDQWIPVSSKTNFAFDTMETAYPIHSVLVNYGIVELVYGYEQPSFNMTANFTYIEPYVQVQQPWWIQILNSIINFFYMLGYYIVHFFNNLI